MQLDLSYYQNIFWDYVQSIPTPWREFIPLRGSRLEMSSSASMSSSNSYDIQTLGQSFEAALEECRARATSVDMDLDKLALLTQSSVDKYHTEDNKQCEDKTNEVRDYDGDILSKKHAREDDGGEEVAGDSKRLKQAHESASAAMAHESVSTSMALVLSVSENERANLDTLPTEIVQHIFSYGTNFRLPRVNSRLYAMLNVDAVKIKFLLQAFSFSGSNELKYPIHADTEKLWDESPLAEDLHDNGPVKSRKHELNLDLLKQRWLTAELFQKCQWLQLYRTAVQALRYFTASLSPMCRDAETKAMEESMKENFAWGVFSSKHVYRPRPTYTGKNPSPPWSNPPWKTSYECVRPDGSMFKLFMPDYRGLNTTLIILIEFDNDDKKPLLIASAFPVLSWNSPPPAKFLEGPWTQQHGAALEAFINACPWSRRSYRAVEGRICVTQEHRLAAQRGLKAAIRAWNAPAARMLLGTPRTASVALNRARVFAESQRCLHPRRRLLIGPEKPRSTGGVAPPLNPDLRLDSTGPWRTINEACFPAWKRWCNYPGRNDDCLRLVLRVGPIGRLGWAWYHWLGAHDKTSFDELQSIARKIRPEITDPARLDMLDSLIESNSRYYESG